MSSLKPRLPSIPSYEGDAAVARLQHFHFGDGHEIAEALMSGAAAYRSCNLNHPASYPGSRMWGETTAQLLSGMALHGWDPVDLTGLRLAFNPKHGRALLVVAGDTATGYTRYVPQARYPRGDVSIQLVNENQGVLFGEHLDGNPVWDVWFLLHHVGGLGVAAEVSKPAGVDGRGHVVSWHERILLPFTSFEPDAESRIPAPAPDEPLTVERRAG